VKERAMGRITDILPAEEDFLETMRLDGPPRATWTISRRDGHWIIGWADEDGELMATGEGSTFAEAWEAAESIFIAE
jgi:hypothetical protein